MIRALEPPPLRKLRRVPAIPGCFFLWRETVIWKKPLCKHDILSRVFRSMGADGGSIPTRGEMVKVKKKATLVSVNPPSSSLCALVFSGFAPRNLEHILR